MNEEQQARQTQVTVTNMPPGLADASPVATFIFSTFCVISFPLMMGWLQPGTASSMAFGLVQFLCFVPWMIASILLIKQGNQFGGNTFFIFAVCFAGVGGGFNLFGPILEKAGYAFDHALVGWVFLTGGIYLLLVLPVVAYGDLANFLVMLFAGIGVLMAGLGPLGVFGYGQGYAIASQVGGIALLLDGLVGFYTLLHAQFKVFGVILPVGPVLRKPK